jgi:hypothetical protein
MRLVGGQADPYFLCDAVPPSHDPDLTVGPVSGPGDFLVRAFEVGEGPRITPIARDGFSYLPDGMLLPINRKKTPDTTLDLASHTPAQVFAEAAIKPFRSEHRVGERVHVPRR